MIVYVAMVALLVVLLLAFATFDSLLKIERSEHVDAWIGDGSPTGFFYSPPGGKSAGTMSGSSSRERLLSSWAFATPAWAGTDLRARRLLWRMRLCCAIWIVGVPMTAVLSAVWVRR